MEGILTPSVKFCYSNPQTQHCVKEFKCFVLQEFWKSAETKQHFYAEQDLLRYRLTAS
jgi:hypothetical protein